MTKKRDHDEASLQLAGCFSTEELELYGLGGLPEAKREAVFYHLNVERCKRCRELFELVMQDGGWPVQAPEETPAAFVAREPILPARRFQTPPTLAPGQVWTTAAIQRDAAGRCLGEVPVSPPVLVTMAGNGERSFENMIRVMPLSFDLQFEFPPQTIVLGQDSPLGYPVLVEVFNERPMLAGNLDEYRGEVPASILSLLQEARGPCLSGQGPRADAEFLSWKEREVELTAHLSFPVNQALWEEEDAVRIIEIPVQAYRKAADEGGENLSEIALHRLLETRDLHVAMVQKRDQFLLRCAAKKEYEGPAPRLFVNGRQRSMRPAGPGVFETVLGGVEQVPLTMRLILKTDAEEHAFSILFKKGSPRK